jgi:integrase
VFQFEADVAALLDGDTARAHRFLNAAIPAAAERAAGILERRYGEQAGMLNRSLFEDMIVAHWLKRNPGSSAKLERHRGRQTIGNAMRNACKNAGIASYSPHDLRHRYISVKIREGVPITNIAAHVGHSRKSLTRDTYAHVLIDE